MEPILPEPTAPNVMPQNQEANLSGGSNSETRPNTAVEHAREAPPTSHSQATQQPVVQQMPQVPQQVTHTVAQQPVQDDNPIIADDVDVIEKEWVDKAKRIVNATKEDPFSQEKEVSKLQADYLMKRYNKQVKLSE